MWFCRPSDRSKKDVDMIYSRLRELPTLHKFPPVLLHEICYFGYYEDLEEGIVCMYNNRDFTLKLLSLVNLFIACITCVSFLHVAQSLQLVNSVFWNDQMGLLFYLYNRNL